MLSKHPRLLPLRDLVDVVLNVDGAEEKSHDAAELKPDIFR